MGNSKFHRDPFELGNRPASQADDLIIYIWMFKATYFVVGLAIRHREFTRLFLLVRAGY